MIQSIDISLKRPQSIILNLPDLFLGEGEKLLILGPSGCGKTTLLSILAGLLIPTTGQILFKNDDIYKFSSRERDRLRGQFFGFVFQNLHLLPSLSVEKNIKLAADMTGLEVNSERLYKLLERLELSDKAHRKPDALSQGEQQRTAIARAVFNNPLLIIADEPTSALDDRNATNVIDLLIAQAEETGAALLIATHDQRIKSRFDRVLTLDTI